MLESNSEELNSGRVSYLLAEANVTSNSSLSLLPVFLGASATHSLSFSFDVKSWLKIVTQINLQPNVIILFLIGNALKLLLLILVTTLNALFIEIDSLVTTLNPFILMLVVDLFNLLILHCIHEFFCNLINITSQATNSNS